MNTNFLKIITILQIIIFCSLNTIAQTTTEFDYLKGKKIGFIGDSYVKNHRDPVAYSWHYKFAQKYGMEYYNYGRNGNSIAYHSPKWGEGIYTRYLNMNDSLDYIVVIAGHNDSFKLDSIGGIEVFKERLSSLCEGLIDKYPQSKIFFFTPWTCKSFQDSNRMKVVDTMIEVCRCYSIPVFDSARNSGIHVTSDNFRKIYFQKSKNNKDTAHLNNKGHDRFLSVAERFILFYL